MTDLAELASELEARIERARTCGTGLDSLIDVWNFIDIHSVEVLAALRAHLEADK